MFQEKLKLIRSTIDDLIERAKQEAVREIFVKSTSRIFDKGQTAQGTQIGTYSDAYKERRKEKGLQTSNVDLTFSTKLSKSITNNESQVYFSNTYGVNIAGYNEKHFQKRIFAPTESERQIFYDKLDEELNKLWK